MADYEDIVNPNVYLAFTGLGKTHYCQTHPGWMELDEEFFIRTQVMNLLYTAVRCYTQYGYNILSNASSRVIDQLRLHCDLTIILPENTPEAKEFILNNIKNRNYGDKVYKKWIQENYDLVYECATRALKPTDNVIYVPAGKYLEEILDDLLK